MSKHIKHDNEQELINRALKDAIRMYFRYGKKIPHNYRIRLMQLKRNHSYDENRSLCWWR